MGYMASSLKPELGGDYTLSVFREAVAGSGNVVLNQCRNDVEVDF
jgi:hypothetical protein